MKETLPRAPTSSAFGAGCTLKHLSVATPVTPINDSEELIRRIPSDSPHYAQPTQGCKLTSTAFNDPNRQPSVDRRGMKASLDACKLAPTDGLVCLIAEEVRRLELLEYDNGKPTGSKHTIDVLHRPVEAGNPQGLAENSAHSQIETTPAISGSRFNKLKEALARLAEKRGWLVEPC